MTTPREYRFNVFGNLFAIRRDAAGTGWETFALGNEGKRRPGGFVVPEFVPPEGLAQYLADLFHESAKRRNDRVVPID